MTEAVRTILALLLTVAITVRSLVPMGFMLAPVSDGVNSRVTIVVCSASGLGLVTLDEDGKPIIPQPGKEGGESCLYKHTSALAVLVSEPSLTGFAQYGPIAEWRSQAKAPQSRHELPAPARGPPLSQTLT